MQCAKSKSSNGLSVRIALFAISFGALALLQLVTAIPASAESLSQIRQTSTLTLGYLADLRPFSYRDESGRPAGYSVALCKMIADQVKAELGLRSLAVNWVPVTLSDRFLAVRQGTVDLVCGADTATLTRRRDVSFSIPIFPSGIGAILRTDSPVALQNLLSGGPAPSRPIWRGSPARTILEKKTFSVVSGTTSEGWLAERIDTFQITATVAPVRNFQAGIQRVVDGSSDVFFGDRPILLDAAVRSSSASDLVVLDRLFTVEPIALAFARGDEDLRLVVDRTLSRLFRSKKFPDVYAEYFGRPDQSTLTFFRQSALPE